MILTVNQSLRALLALQSGTGVCPVITPLPPSPALCDHSSLKCSVQSLLSHAQFPTLPHYLKIRPDGLNILASMRFTYIINLSSFFL